MKRTAIWGLLGLLACGKERDSVPIVPGGGGSDRDAETPDRRVDAGSTVDPLAPVIAFEGLSSASDPNQDTLVTSRSLMVKCRVTRSDEIGSSAIEKSAVKISPLTTEGETTKMVSATVDALGDDLYQGTFELGDLPNGPISFRCEARDTASKPHTGSTTLNTLLDLGPTIEIMEPKDGMIYALKTPRTIKFRVTGAPLSGADEEAEVKSVKLTIGGADTPVQESETTPGLYQTSIDFGDRTNYPVPPTSAEISVSATNARTPQPATRSHKVDITIDGVGPTIRVTNPPAGSIVHGVVKLQVNISDASGIKPDTLLANINFGSLVIDQWEGTAPTFSAKFDSRRFQDLTQLTINITAADTVSNEDEVSHQLKLDNYPPEISLDPPAIAESKNCSGKTCCSAPFDPVGSAASDDSNVNGTSRFRALVEDRTNQAAGAVSYFAGVDTSSVKLYLQKDLSIPLLIDTDGDGICDDINYENLAKEQRPVFIQLDAVTPTGTAWFWSETDDLSHKLPLGCSYGGESSPKTICPGFTEMVRVVPGRLQSKPPAVFAYRPTNSPSDGECTGTDWQLVDIANDGWQCLAARVEDKIAAGAGGDGDNAHGNIGVSAPLRICFDKTPNDGRSTVCSVSQRPSCTDGCTISEAQKFRPDEIWPIE